MTQNPPDRERITMGAQRIEWIDVAKGIAMLTVIMGHTCWGVLRGIIYSFHMPLFFIFSTMTYKFATDMTSFKRNVKKSFIHLILPYLAVCLVVLLKEILLTPDLFLSAEFWRGRLFCLVFASGVDVWFGNIYVPAITYPWFLCALFLGRTAFDYMQMRLSRESLLIICLLSSAVGIALGDAQWTPMSIDIILASMPFLYVGYYQRDKMKNGGKQGKLNNPILRLLAFGAIWLVTFYLTSTDRFTASYFEVAVRRYPVFPICYVCAVAGTFFLAEICKILTKSQFISTPFKALGKYSLILLVLHSADSAWSVLWIDGNFYIESAKRIIVDILLLLIIILIINIVQKLSEDAPLNCKYKYYGRN